MKKSFLILILLLVFSNVYGVQNEDVLVSSTSRYFKTVTREYDLQNMNNNHSQTFEITEEEFENFNIGLNDVVNTTYKKLTTNIYASGNLYKYEVVLQWKNIPKVRSYDIIGIAYNSNVIYNSDMDFKQSVTGTSSSYVLRDYTKCKSSDGYTAVFQIPTENIVGITQIFSFKVRKNASTVYLQTAVGDYSHATSNISLNNAIKHSISTQRGIELNDSIKNYYDSIVFSQATWNGTW